MFIYVTTSKIIRDKNKKYHAHKNNREIEIKMCYKNKNHKRLAQGPNIH